MLTRLVTLALFVVSINAADLQSTDQRDDLLIAVSLLEKQLQDVRQMVAALPRLGAICPYPYEQVLDECFFLSKISLNWNEARQYCQGMQGDLATPKNVYALKSYALDRYSGENEVWLGSTDKHKEGQWKWLDGRPVDKGEWHSGQPDDSERREDCLDLRLNWHPPFNDYRCNVAQRFMCQFKG
ncbi:C-type Lectin CRL-like isoform X2 [Penaeus japonicus]|uniref:C-type Lectin CRL-like isoform X2 n=1 Tax=Penaeus japonicus TaxID=27405 RepID=UPI001C71183F|nr:C-type Lectin CRL-like isoform X2 [Penaeus japonicus]